MTLYLLLGIVLGVILAAGVIVATILVLVATGSLWLMGSVYLLGMTGFVLVGIGLAQYIDAR